METNNNTKLLAGLVSAGIMMAGLYKLYGNSTSEAEAPESEEEYKAWKSGVSKGIMSKAKFYNDFPKKGVTFMDLFSITQDPAFFRQLNEDTAKIIRREVGEPGVAFTHVVGLESRGFIQGPILAQIFDLPFTVIRKKGKLPGECYQQEYGTEYSKDVCEIQKDSLPAGAKVLIVDDLLATGGTLLAAESLCLRMPGVAAAANFCLFEIAFFKGRDRLAGKMVSVVELED